ncbi:hypothetical protein [Streptomyces sp. NPDC059883]
MAGAIEAGDPLRVLPVVFHLLWSQVLEADVVSQLLGPDSTVHIAKGR